MSFSVPPYGIAPAALPSVRPQNNLVCQIYDPKEPKAVFYEGETKLEVVLGNEKIFAKLLSLPLGEWLSSFLRLLVEGNQFPDVIWFLGDIVEKHNDYFRQNRISPQIVETLITILNSSQNCQKGIRAAEAFGKIYPFLEINECRRVLWALQGGLEGVNNIVGYDVVAQASAHALGKIGFQTDQELQLHIINVLHHSYKTSGDYDVRKAIVEAWNLLSSGIGDQEKAHLFRTRFSEALTDQDAEVRCIAASALASLNKKSPLKKPEELLAFWRQALTTRPKTNEKEWTNIKIQKFLTDLQSILPKEQHSGVFKEMLEGLRNNRSNEVRLAVNEIYKQFIPMISLHDLTGGRLPKEQ